MNMGGTTLGRLRAGRWWLVASRAGTGRRA